MTYYLAHDHCVSNNTRTESQWSISYFFLANLSSTARTFSKRQNFSTWLTHEGVVLLHC